MADTEFDLGEALGSYEQAQADRNFYLSMVQGGTTAASPIAAYLAGVAGVKMANMRAKYQDIKDAKQAQLDAEAAKDKLQKRHDTIQGQIINIMKGARDGSIAPGAAAAMLGPLTKELGYTLKAYDADNNEAIYNVPGDSQDYVWDLGPSTSQLESGRQKRAEERIAWEKEKQEKSIQAQKDLAQIRKSGSGSEKTTTLSSFNSSHKAVNDAFGKEFKMNKLTKAQVQAYIEGAEGLSENDKKSVQPKVEELLQLASKKGWRFSSPVKKAVSFDLNSLFERS